MTLPAGLDPARTIIIAEKTSQAKDLQAALGTSYGRVLAAEGHLLELAEPDDVREDWKTWGAVVLRPDSGRYPTRVAKGGNKGPKLRQILDALKGATGVVLATDCDREGQLIGQEILEYAKFRGQVWRAIFTAQDATSLQQAFAKLQPNSAFADMFAAAVARQQADQIFNLSLTRTATTQLRPPNQRGVIGVGRVKTPTLAIVCKRELEIRNFVPQDYFEIVVLGDVGGASPATIRLRHAPKERLTTREAAAQIAARADGFRGPLAVVVEDKRRGPPKLFDLPALQKTCGGRWGWSAAKTLEVAQELYDGEGKKILTYPRAEARYLSENQIVEVPALLAGLQQHAPYASLIPAPPVVRKGKSGTFSDKALAGVSHHAIIPNVNTIGDLQRIWPKLSGDEQRLFDLVARSYLAALSPDYEYRQTTATITVPAAGPAPAADFVAKGAVPVVLGWKAVLQDPPVAKGEKKAADGGDEADDEGEETELPPLTDGSPTRLHDPVVEAKQTQPPPRYNEGSLISAMQEAWRFVDDPTLRERLKEAKGIGTPATRAEVLEGLKRQAFLHLSGKHIVPTDAGLALYALLAQTAPVLVDPGTTAQWETRLDAVNAGETDAQTVIDELSEAAGRLIDDMVRAAAAGQRLTGGPSGGAPTPKMVALAKKIAKERKLKLPKDTVGSFDALKQWLDAQLGTASGPSDKQVAFAQRIARATGVALPPETLASGKELRAWIDAHKPPEGTPLPMAPSAKQLALAEDLATQLGESLPPEVREDGKTCSAWIDQAMPRAQAKKPPTEKQLAFAEALATQYALTLPSSARQTSAALSAWIDTARGVKTATDKTCPRCGTAKLDQVQPPTGTPYYLCQGQSCGFSLPVGSRRRKDNCPQCHGVVLERQTRVTIEHPEPRPYWGCAKCTWRAWIQAPAGTG